MDRQTIDGQAEQTIISSHFPDGYGGPWEKVEPIRLRGSEVRRGYRCHASDGKKYLAKIFEQGSIWETALRRPTGIELLKSLKLRPQDRLEIPLLWPPVKLDGKYFFTFVEDFGADNAFHACFVSAWSSEQFELWLQTIASALASFNLGNRDLVTIGMEANEITHIRHGDFNFRNIITVGDSVSFIDTANCSRIREGTPDFSNMTYILWYNYVAAPQAPHIRRGMVSLPFHSYAGLVNTFILKYFETARSLLPVTPEGSQFRLKDWILWGVMVAMEKLEGRIQTGEKFSRPPDSERVKEFQNYLMEMRKGELSYGSDALFKKIDIPTAAQKIV